MKKLLSALASLDIQYSLKDDLLFEDRNEVHLDNTGIVIYCSTDYWRYPGLMSYFVNHNRDDGGLTTINLNKVIYLIGKHSK